MKILKEKLKFDRKVFENDRFSSNFTIEGGLKKFSAVNVPSYADLLRTVDDSVTLNNSNREDNYQEDNDGQGEKVNDDNEKLKYINPTTDLRSNEK